MSKQQNPKQPPQIQVLVKPDDMKGTYANIMQVNHRPDEFIMDFLMAFAGKATLNIRLITSPRHMKAMLHAIADNIKKYETIFGEIKPTELAPNIVIKPSAQA